MFLFICKVVLIIKFGGLFFGGMGIPKGLLRPTSGYVCDEVSRDNQIISPLT